MKDASRGQATLEAALLLPVALVLVVTIFDVGRAILLAADLQSAADGVARSLEASAARDATPEQAVRSACEAYPGFAGKVEAAIVRGAHEVWPVDYRLYDPTAGAYHARASHVGRDRYDVKLTLTEGWISPVIAALSRAGGAGGSFTLRAGSIATVDTTLEEW